MVWQIYGIWIAAASVLTFLLYGFDKAQSKTEGWRIPEVYLHGLALAGGRYSTTRLERDFLSWF
jgi:uncharacterized membrane protein YsdA (DUF1294 family)